MFQESDDQTAEHDPNTPAYYLKPDLEKMLELEVKVEVEVLAKENPDFYYHIVMSGMQSLATSPQVELAPFYQPVEPLFTLDTLEETSMFDLRSTDQMLITAPSSSLMGKLLATACLHSIPTVMQRYATEAHANADTFRKKSWKVTQSRRM
ncbi:hypothetical protein RSOL_511450, partial [Rhizoctonia solani AG-3 Rhs1AP]